MINWSKGISASYFMTLVDPETWLDYQTVKITGGSIKKSVSGLRESATVHTTGVVIDQECWIRVYMIARQGEASERVPLFTGLAAVPSGKRKGRLIITDLECYSVLSVIDDILMPRGWYAPVGTNAPDLLRSLLVESSIAPFTVEEISEPPRLTESIVAEGGETYLTMIEKILIAIEWRIKIGGDGKIYILPMAKDENDIVETFNSINYDIIDADTEIDKETDAKSCPNVFRAVLNDSYAIAKDENEDSPFSINSRGREIWAEEQNVILSDKETLSDYAIRRLKELQEVTTTVSYDRRFVPSVLPSDVIKMSYPGYDLIGVFLVSSQDIELNYGASVTEEVKQI